MYISALKNKESCCFAAKLNNVMPVCRAATQPVFQIPASAYLFYFAKNRDHTVFLYHNFADWKFLRERILSVEINCMKKTGIKILCYFIFISLYLIPVDIHG